MQYRTEHIMLSVQTIQQILYLGHPDQNYLI